MLVSMAFTYPLTLNPSSYGGQTEDKVYSIVDLPRANALRVVSRVVADAPAIDNTMTVSHAESKSNGVTYGRHLMRGDLTKTDDNVGEVTASFYVVAVIPEGQTAISDQDLLDLKGRVLAGLQASGTWDAFLGGELLG